MTQDRPRFGHSGAPSGPAAHEAAAALLRELLPQALVAPDGDVEQLSPIAEAQRPYWRIDNLAGVHVYQTVDGWYADVMLRTVPPGVANAIGTPLQSPEATREAAIAAAIAILRMVASNEAQTPPQPTDTRGFGLDGIMLECPAKMLGLAAVAALVSDTTVERAEARLHVMLDEDFPQRATGEAWGALPSDRRLRYMLYVAFLLSTGRVRFARRGPAIKSTP